MSYLQLKCEANLNLLIKGRYYIILNVLSLLHIFDVGKTCVLKKKENRHCS